MPAEPSTDFGRLWLDSDAGVLATRKDVQRFAVIHERVDGVPSIIVEGKERRLTFRYVGAGLYRASTIAEDVAAGSLPRKALRQFAAQQQ